MADHLVEKEKAKAEAAAKIKTAEKRELHSFCFLHSLFNTKIPINSYHCALNAKHFLQAGHPTRTRTRTILGLILCGMLAY